MGTKSIDTIQTEQLALLENDINELKTKLNLLVDDITRPLNSQLGAGAAAIVNSIINNIVNMHGRINGEWPNNYKAPNNQVPLGGDANNPPWSNPPYNTQLGAWPTDGILKRLTEIDDLYTQHISRKFPPIVDHISIPRIGYTGLTHTHPEGWVCNNGTCLTATISKTTGSGWPSGTHNMYQWPFRPNPKPEGWLNEQDAKAHIAVTNGTITFVSFTASMFGGTHPLSSYGYGWSNNDSMISDTTLYGSTFTGTVNTTGSQCDAVPNTNAGSRRSPESDASSGFGDDSPGVGGPEEQAIQAGGETSSGDIMKASSAMHPDEASTTVVNASVDANYPTTAATVFFLEDEKKSDLARAKKLVRKTLNTLRSK